MITRRKNSIFILTVMMFVGALLGPHKSFAGILDAAEAGNLIEVRALIKAEANVNAKDRNGMTALMFAAKQGYEKMVQELINSKAELNAQDNQGMTALIMAVKEDHLEVVKMLLAIGKGDTNAKKPGGVMTFISSLTSHSEPESKLGVTRIDVNKRDNERMTALSYATTKGNLEMVQTLLDANADVNAKRPPNNREMTELMFASWGGNLALVQILIAAKADVNAMDSEGMTALMGSTIKGAATQTEEVQIEIIKALLAAKADVNAKKKGTPKNGWTALMFASYYGNIPLVQTLLAAKAEINATALSIAKDNNRADVVRLFEQAGVR